MKVKHYTLLVLLAFFVCFFGGITCPVSADSVQNFYFKDFNADYYLTKAADGSSNLHVKEVLTAVFPETNQNHGINRIIPYSNQGDTNLTIRDQDAMNLTVLRNGQPEPVHHIDRENGAYIVYIGDANEYVHGEQTYVLEYDYTNVIAEFDRLGFNVSGQDVAKAFQELYWDTNGNGWQQRFENLTASVHLPEAIAMNVIADDTSCYVGAYGAMGYGRCSSNRIEDGFKFTAQNLAPGENLTFAIRFRPGTFVFKYETSYWLLIILAAEIVIASILIIRRVQIWRKKAQPQYHLYKSLFTAPQYLPPSEKDIHVAEGGQLYIGRVRPSYVATLLELAVTKAVTISKKPDEKKPNKFTWSVHINVEPETLSKSQMYMLRILADKENVSKGEDIIIQKHRPTSTLSGYARMYDTNAKKVLKESGYLKKKGMKESAALIWVLVGAFFLVEILISATNISSQLDYMINYTRPVGGKLLSIGLMLVVVVVATIVIAVLSARTRKYYPYTESGIRLAKYLEGLELYIKMAEVDRLKFLQSVEGVDTSNQGIVKLYEKLLPWACLFGLEKSWMEELQKYYEIEGGSEIFDTDLLTGMAVYNMTRDLSSSVNSSIAYYNSSGGGSSSSSSGGGGGGFSGGGGGGGGGGGW